ncbi:DUF2922 domain-containing protein [Rummeliibacillus sp. TYF-LIM-RU47]|uniref:DUF2922 domain-containing protein n=1 Tax=Rummeliibacillus sp. TYF-LIM-RU47 TaxID=2608406 RepID=UPI0012387A95|nr:DUF2922 domain-containing protein [Rummeliibacillus sp. TYF-LIM-RU47]
MSKVLQLQFQTSKGTDYSISIDVPKEGLSSKEVYDVMNTIIEKGVFEIKGERLAEIDSARYVERTVTELEA